VPRLTRRLGYVFIATYGRSGSTLLQGILNSSPGVLVRGENAGAPVLLWRYHRRLTRHHNRVGRTKALTAQHPWFGIDGYPQDTALDDIRRLLTDTLLRPEKSTRIVGYKDIAWPRRTEIVEYAEFLQRVFPDARIVVNTRDIAATARSGWWAKDPAASAQIQEIHESLLFLHEQMPQSTYHVHFDDYVADPGRLAGLFEWLDLDFDRAAIEAVMAVKHSYHPRTTLEQ
jgi:hypothetical protein